MPIGDDPPDAVAPTGSLFITGMLRSGTTLLDKLLGMHPQLTVASQPFFEFYVQTKLAQLDGAHRGVVPFTPQFREDPRNRDGFEAWLGRETLAEGVLDAIAARCTKAKGQGAPSLRDRRFALTPERFVGVWRQLHGYVAEAYGAPGAHGLVGSKEVLCEEFLPTLAAAGVKCILCVRDPRAVIASMNRGNYRKSVGDTYPILMNIRNWRKSVAYLLRLQDHTSVLGLRYEDLVGDGGRSQQRIAGFLGVRDFDPAWYAGGMRDQEQQPWAGNSSFKAKNSLDASGVEHWRETLEPETARFIEFCTYPELRALGYPVDAGSWDPAVLDGYREDPAQLRPDYLLDYGLSESNLAGEAARRECLRSAAEVDTDTQRSLFLFDAAYRRLRASVQT